MVAVVDGDTIVVRHDRAGLNPAAVKDEVVFRIRLNGCNAPEKNTPAGNDAKDWMVAACPTGQLVLVAPAGAEKYGRVLADVWRSGEDRTLSELAVGAGHAAPWDGRGRRPLPPG